MIDLNVELPRAEAAIASFEVEVAKLRELEQNQASLKAELAASKARETEILSDHTGDAKTVAKKLAEQRALSDTIASRMEDVETAWRRAYDLGGVAANTLFRVADEFRVRFEFSRRPLFDYRPEATYSSSFSATIPRDRQLATIHQRVTEWATTLRPLYERLSQDYGIYAVLRKETVAAAMGFSAQPDTSNKPAPHMRPAKELAK